MEDVISADDNEADAFRDECGVFGILGRVEAAAVVTLGLHALQHRGQEAAGIVAYDGTQFSIERHIGLIGDTFTKRSVLDRMPFAMCSRSLPNSPAAVLPSHTTATSPTL